MERLQAITKFAEERYPGHYSYTVNNYPKSWDTLTRMFNQVHADAETYNILTLSLLTQIEAIEVSEGID